MSEDVVERVARALFERETRAMDGWSWDKEAVDRALREYWMDSARAAITAMRDASPAMWEGWRSVNCQIGADGMEEFTHFSGDYGNWLACHHAMIDAALGEAAKKEG